MTSQKNSSAAGEAYRAASAVAAVQLRRVRLRVEDAQQPVDALHRAAQVHQALDRGVPARPGGLRHARRRPRAAVHAAQDAHQEGGGLRRSRPSRDQFGILLTTAGRGFISLEGLTSIKLVGFTCVTS